MINGEWYICIYGSYLPYARSQKIDESNGIIKFLVGYSGQAKEHLSISCLDIVHAARQTIHFVLCNALIFRALKL
jgi:hypothetical protein